MLSPKHIKLVLAATAAASLLVFLVATSDFGETHAAGGTLKAKLLRRHDKTKLKPTINEINFLRSQASPKEERQLEDKIPKHLPIKVKIKAEKEKQFKDRDNTHWARDFELEVKNTGTKPIYRLGLLLLLPETEISGGRLVFPLHYGRTELSVFQDPLELAKPQDIPIAPGETYIFKIPEDQVGPWERLAKTEGWPQPKKVIMKFEELSFGDGTGFRWGEGVAWPQSPGWNRKAGLG